MASHPSRTRGFTLIEMLVVIAILSLLAMFLIPSLSMGRQKGEIAETEARMTFLRTAIDRFERVSQTYPPDDFTTLDPKVSWKRDDINTGIESLILHLHVKRGGQSTLEDKQQWLSNTDQDHNTVESPVLGTNEKYEVVDAWGTPIAYFAAQYGGYAKEQSIQRTDGTIVKVGALTDTKGKPLHPTKYQLISAGPDQEFGTEDDVSYPELATR